MISMNDTEMEQLLIRLDERTERIDNRVSEKLDRIEEKSDKNAGRIDTLDSRVQKNEDIMKIITGGVATILAGTSAKLAGILRL